jgi:hypothetical protein
LICSAYSTSRKQHTNKDELYEQASSGVELSEKTEQKRSRTPKDDEHQKKEKRSEMEYAQMGP